MKKTFLIFASLALVAIIFCQITLPVFVYAVYTPLTPGSGVSTPLTPGTSVTIQNPLKVNSIQCFISIALQFVVDILAIAAVLYIMWAGFLFVKAQGNPEELKTAKTALLHALIGTGIVLGAWGLATVVSNTVNQVTKSNNGLPSQNSCNS